MRRHVMFLTGCLVLLAIGIPLASAAARGLASMQVEFAQYAQVRE